MKDDVGGDKGEHRGAKEEEEEGGHGRGQTVGEEGGDPRRRASPFSSCSSGVEYWGHRVHIKWGSGGWRN